MSIIFTKKELWINQAPSFNFDYSYLADGIDADKLKEIKA